MDNWNPFGAGPMSIRKHCHKRVHARARETLKVFSLVDCLSMSVGRMQRDFGLMRYHVECRNPLKAIFRLLLRACSLRIGFCSGDRS
jgi:hypothetical protein